MGKLGGKWLSEQTLWSSVTRKATKNLPWGEWLASFFGTTKGDRHPDHHFAGPCGPDRHYLYSVLCCKGRDEHGNITVPSVIEELEARGYDTTTLEFRIQRKPKAP